MKKHFPLFLACLLGATNIFGQAKPPKPTPTPDNDVVKISTNLIQIDVTVIDGKGKVVTDLRPDEIEIYQDGKKQNLTNFLFVSNVREVHDEQRAKPRTQTPAVNLPPSPPQVQNVKRTIALVIANLSFQSMYSVRRALRKFVDESMQEGDLVAIVRTSSGSGVLQQFTTDKRLLRAAIDDIRFDSIRNSQMAFAPISASNAETTLKSSTDREKEIDDFQELGFVSSTLKSLNFIVNGMQGMPGRKSVMLLSDGFPLTFHLPGGMIDSNTVPQEIRRVVDSANRASVIIDTLDARGVVDTSFGVVDNLTNSNGVMISGQELTRAIVGRNLKVVDDQQGPGMLAKQTGGIAIVNNNDLSAVIRNILDDQSYYLIGYQPDEDTFDPKTRPFRKFQVKVKRSGVTVRNRSGFFGVNDEKLAKPEMTSGQRLVTALISPFAVNEIGVRLNTIFTNDVKLGSHIRSLMHIRAQDLTFTDGPNETKTAVFDVIAAGINGNGQPFDTINESYTLTANKAVYEKYMADGFVYGFTFPVKYAGAYQLRVALRDRGSDKIGSANQVVEVPDVSNNRIALSGIFLENVSIDERSKPKSSPTEEINGKTAVNSLADTALRRFRRGTILNYAFNVFNAKLDSDHKTNLNMQVRVFRNGKMLLEGRPEPISYEGQSDLKRIGSGGSLSLGGEIEAGDYVLQIIVNDGLAKTKEQIATQFVQFEVIG